MTMNFKQWEAAVRAGKVEDISAELPDGFLMFGQLMRAKIRFEGAVYLASAWATGEVRLDPA